MNYKKEIIIGALSALVAIGGYHWGPALLYSFSGFSSACSKIETGMSSGDVSTLMQGYKVMPDRYINSGERVGDGESVEYSQSVSWWKTREHHCRVHIENGNVTKVIKVMFGYPDLQVVAK